MHTLKTVGIKLAIEWRHEAKKMFPLDLWSSVSDIGVSGLPTPGVLKWISHSANTVQSLSVARSNTYNPCDRHRLRRNTNAAEPENELPALFLPNLRALATDLAVPTGTAFDMLGQLLPSAPWNLIDRIAAPSLQKLKVTVRRQTYSSRDAEEGWDMASFSDLLHSFMARSQCSLTHLHLDIPQELPSSELVEFLSSDGVSPKLKTLIVKNCKDLSRR